MPRIAVIGLRGVPASFGGVEQQCEHLYSRLAAMGHRITIYARKGYVPEGTTAYRGMTVRILPTIGTKHLEAFVHTFLAVLDLWGSDTEIVHIYGQGPCLFSPLLKLFNKRVKVFFTCGGLDWRRKKWSGFASFVIHLGELCSAFFTDCRVTVSRELKKYYESRYGVSADFIPNGMPVPVHRPLESFEQDGFGRQGYFLFVGRLVPEKRIEDVIGAYLKKPRENVLVIVGESAGTDRYVSMLRSAAASGAGNKVHFLGYRFGKELEELFSNALGFVNASELEGLPLTVLEATRYGIPCLLSDIPPHREMAEMGGFEERLFAVGDTDALSGLMEGVEAMSATERETAGNRIAESIAGVYSWEKAAGLLHELYMKSLT